MLRISDIKAKFYAFDANGNQQNPSSSEITVSENGTPAKCYFCNVSVDCSAEGAFIGAGDGCIAALMAGGSIDIAKAAATFWLIMYRSEIPNAPSRAFDDANYFNQDFTTNRKKLVNAIAGLHPQNGTNYDAGLLLPVSGRLASCDACKASSGLLFFSPTACRISSRRLPPSSPKRRNNIA